MNGSGLHGGGGAGGGYVPSQGWEFMPCSRMDRADRGRGKARSPLRRISSPPTVFSQIYESQFDASASGGAGEPGTQLEILRGQMWPGPEPQQQQQQPQQPTHHTRLKKKFEDLKKRHVQDKEEWMREKESLLREVADIQVIGNIYHPVKAIFVLATSSSMVLKACYSFFPVPLMLVYGKLGFVNGTQ